MPGVQSQPDSRSIHPKAEAMAQNLEKLAWLMDRALPIPGTNLRFGLDALLGLFPGGGDVLTGIVQAALVLVTLANYRVPKAVATRMAANVLLDVSVGSIPILGDLFDMGFKANTRNMALLREVRQRQNHGETMPSAPSIRYLVMIGVILLGAVALMAVGFAFLLVWIYKLMTH